MGVRSFLALGVRAVAGVLHKRGSLTQASICEDGIYDHAAASVISDQHEFPVLSTVM